MAKPRKNNPQICLELKPYLTQLRTSYLNNGVHSVGLGVDGKPQAYILN